MSVSLLSRNRMKRPIMRFLSVLAILAVASALFVATEAKPAVAANPAHFDPAYVISDANFFNGNAMTEAEIQAFLVAKGSALANYRSNVPSRAARPSVDIPNHVYCHAFQGGSALLASTIIFRAQQACGISAKVLLVTLQKESRMVVGGDPASFNAHMGYGCPDTAPCNELYYGLGNQLYLASLQFRFYQQPVNNFRYQVGNEYVQYAPDASCGGTTLNIRNWATAALYNYTPYQPTAAALAAYPGATATCGAYGNRNFWFFYSDWFGAPTDAVPGGNPRGAYDEATLTSSKDAVYVRGWAFDSDTLDPILVDIYVDSAWNRTLTANQSRSDVQAAYPGQGPNHGFSATLPLTPGTHSVCAYAINVGSGNLNTPLGCKSVTVPATPPTPPVDPPVPPPVPPVDPPVGPAPEADTGAVPRGDVNEMRVSGSSVILRGWTFDPDTVNPIRADVWVNGGWKATLLANQARPDVKAAFPAQGPNHGFSGTIGLSAGSNQVCMYGINNGKGANPLLQCRVLNIVGATPPVTTPPPTTPPPAVPGGTHNPRGDMNEMSLTGSSLFMRGWTFDADTRDPILADIWVNGRWNSTMNANVSRSDVQAVFPGQGPNHGFSSSITLTKGANQVCVYGINNNAGGANPLIQCRSFAVN